MPMFKKSGGKIFAVQFNKAEEKALNQAINEQIVANDRAFDMDSENDCQFSYDEENEVYTAVLKNADGDTLEVEGDECDFKGMAVAIEIAGTAVEHR